MKWHLAFVWALATGLQAPGLVALARFDTAAVAVHASDGPAVGPVRGRKEGRGFVLRPRGQPEIRFDCRAVDCAGTALSAGGLAHVSWIVAPLGPFGEDLKQPLGVEQGGRLLLWLDAAAVADAAWSRMMFDLVATQVLAALFWLFAAINHQQARERAARASREAKARRERR